MVRETAEWARHRPILLRGHARQAGAEPV